GRCFVGQEVSPDDGVPINGLIPLEVGNDIRVCVQELKSGELRLALAVDSTQCKKGFTKDNALATGHAARAIRKVQLNKREKIVLATAPDGTALGWMEVIVSDRLIDFDPALVPALAAPAAS